MVVILERDIRDDDKSRIRNCLQERGLKVREIVGVEETIFGAVGKVSIDYREVEILPGVERVIPISKPYKLASRELQKAMVAASALAGMARRPGRNLPSAGVRPAIRRCAGCGRPDATDASTTRVPATRKAMSIRPSGLTKTTAEATAQTGSCAG